MTRCVYLDYNATAPLLPEVKDAIILSMEMVGNPASVHQLGRKCRAEIDKARKQVAAAVDTSAKDITFTSGGTESNHIALIGLNIAKEHIYASSVEHASIYKNIHPDNLIPVDEYGQLRLEALQQAFNRPNHPKLLTIGLANSETGIVQHHLHDIIKICRQHGCLVHTDAVQAFGKIPLSFHGSDVDLMTISAHKVGGPKGVGALISKPNIVLKAQLLGGGQEKGIRSGTENVQGIIGFGVAAELAAGTDWRPVQGMLVEMIHQMKAFNPALRINSNEQGLPNTLNVSTPSFNKDNQVIHMDLNGIAISSGSACSSGKVEKSHVLKAMGLEDRYVESAIRISLGPKQSYDDIQQFIEAWQRMQITQKVEGL
jgi:cysteine desulfurase